MTRHPVSAIALTLLVFACVDTTPGLEAGERPPLRPGEVAGCYELRLGDWKFEQAEEDLRPHGLLHSEDSHSLTILTPPTGVMLIPDTAGVYMSRPGWYRAVPLEGPSSNLLRNWVRWQPSGPDSVRIGWSDGYVGVNINLWTGGDTLRGLAESWSDDQSLNAHTRAFAWRVTCSTLEPAGRRRLYR